jgi:hypothetical protein
LPRPLTQVSIKCLAPINGLGTITEVAQDECLSIAQWVEDKMLKSEPKDSWGHTLLIDCPGTHEKGGADIISLGPDGQQGTKDTIYSWKLI